MSALPLGEGSIQQFGYSLDVVAKMANLGMVFAGIDRIDADGTSASSPSFMFVPDSPMGRINRAAGFENRDLLDRAIEDARRMPRDEFASKYLSFGPYIF